MSYTSSLRFLNGRKQIAQQNGKGGNSNLSPVSRQLFKAHYYGYYSFMSRRLTIALKRYIDSATYNTKHTSKFVAEVRRNLISLHEYNLQSFEVKCKYPRSRLLDELLIQYIELECELLYRTYRNINEHDEKYELQVHQRVWALVQLIIHDSIHHAEASVKETSNACFKAMLRIFANVRADCAMENKLVSNIILKLVKKLDLEAKINQLKGAHIGYHKDTYLKDDLTSEIFFSTSDYESDERNSDEDRDDILPAYKDLDKSSFGDALQKNSVDSEDDFGTTNSSDRVKKFQRIKHNPFPVKIENDQDPPSNEKGPVNGRQTSESLLVRNSKNSQNPDYSSVNENHIVPVSSGIDLNDSTNRRTTTPELFFPLENEIYDGTLVPASSGNHSSYYDKIASENAEMNCREIGEDHLQQHETNDNYETITNPDVENSNDGIIKNGYQNDSAPIDLEMLPVSNSENNSQNNDGLITIEILDDDQDELNYIIHKDMEIVTAVNINHKPIKILQANEIKVEENEENRSPNFRVSNIDNGDLNIFESNKSGRNLNSSSLNTFNNQSTDNSAKDAEFTEIISDDEDDIPEERHEIEENIIAYETERVTTRIDELSEEDTILSDADSNDSNRMFENNSTEVEFNEDSFQSENSVLINGMTTLEITESNQKQNMDYITKSSDIRVDDVELNSHTVEISQPVNEETQNVQLMSPHEVEPPQLEEEEAQDVELHSHEVDAPQSTVVKAQDVELSTQEVEGSQSVMDEVENIVLSSHEIETSDSILEESQDVDFLNSHEVEASQSLVEDNHGIELIKSHKIEVSQASVDKIQDGECINIRQVEASQSIIEDNQGVELMNSHDVASQLVEEKTANVESEPSLPVIEQEVSPQVDENGMIESTSRIEVDQLVAEDSSQIDNQYLNEVPVVSSTTDIGIDGVVEVEASPLVEVISGIPKTVDVAFIEPMEDSMLENCEGSVEKSENEVDASSMDTEILDLSLNAKPEEQISVPTTNQERISDTSNDKKESEIMPDNVNLNEQDVSPCDDLSMSEVVEKENTIVTDSGYYESTTTPPLSEVVYETQKKVGDLELLANIAADQENLAVKSDSENIAKMTTDEESSVAESDTDLNVHIMPVTRMSTRRRVSKIKFFGSKKTIKQLRSQQRPIVPTDNSSKKKSKKAVSSSSKNDASILDSKPYDIIAIENSSLPPPPTNNVYAQKRLTDNNTTSEDSNDSCESMLIIDLGNEKVAEKKFRTVFDEDTLDDELQFVNTEVPVCISIPENETNAQDQCFNILKQIEDFVSTSQDGDQNKIVPLAVEEQITEKLIDNIDVAEQKSEVKVESKPPEIIKHSIEHILNKSSSSETRTEPFCHTEPLVSASVKISETAIIVDTGNETQLTMLDKVEEPIVVPNEELNCQVDEAQVENLSLKVRDSDNADKPMKTKAAMKLYDDKVQHNSHYGITTRSRSKSSDQILKHSSVDRHRSASVDLPLTKSFKSVLPSVEESPKEAESGDDRVITSTDQVIVETIENHEVLASSEIENKKCEVLIRVAKVEELNDEIEKCEVLDNMSNEIVVENVEASVEISNIATEKYEIVVVNTEKSEEIFKSITDGMTENINEVSVGTAKSDDILNHALVENDVKISNNNDEKDEILDSFEKTDIVEQTKNCDVIEQYACSEASCKSDNTPKAASTGTIGKSIPDVSVQITETTATVTRGLTSTDINSLTEKKTSVLSSESETIKLDEVVDDIKCSGNIVNVTMKGIEISDVIEIADGVKSPEKILDNSAETSPADIDKKESRGYIKMSHKRAKESSSHKKSTSKTNVEKMSKSKQKGITLEDTIKKMKEKIVGSDKIKENVDLVKSDEINEITEVETDSRKSAKTVENVSKSTDFVHKLTENTCNVEPKENSESISTDKVKEVEEPLRDSPSKIPPLVNDINEIVKKPLEKPQVQTNNDTIIAPVIPDKKTISESSTKIPEQNPESKRRENDRRHKSSSRSHKSSSSSKKHVQSDSEVEKSRDKKRRSRSSSKSRSLDKKVKHHSDGEVERKRRSKSKSIDRKDKHYEGEHKSRSSSKSKSLDTKTKSSSDKAKVEQSGNESQKKRTDSHSKSKSKEKPAEDDKSRIKVDDSKTKSSTKSNKKSDIESSHNKSKPSSDDKKKSSSTTEKSLRDKPHKNNKDTKGDTEKEKHSHKSKLAPSAAKESGEEKENKTHKSNGDKSRNHSSHSKEKVKSESSSKDKRDKTKKIDKEKERDKSSSQNKDKISDNTNDDGSTKEKLDLKPHGSDICEISTEKHDIVTEKKLVERKRKSDHEEVVSNKKAKLEVAITNSEGNVDSHLSENLLKEVQNVPKKDDTIITNSFDCVNQEEKLHSEELKINQIANAPLDSVEKSCKIEECQEAILEMPAISRTAILPTLQQVIEQNPVLVASMECAKVPISAAFPEDITAGIICTTLSNSTPLTKTNVVSIDVTPTTNISTVSCPTIDKTCLFTFSADNEPNNGGNLNPTNLLEDISPTKLMMDSSQSLDLISPPTGMSRTMNIVQNLTTSPIRFINDGTENSEMNKATSFRSSFSGIVGCCVEKETTVDHNYSSIGGPLVGGNGNNEDNTILTTTTDLTLSDSPDDFPLSESHLEDFPLNDDNLISENEGLPDLGVFLSCKEENPDSSDQFPMMDDQDVISKPEDLQNQLKALNTMMAGDMLHACPKISSLGNASGHLSESDTSAMDEVTEQTINRLVYISQNQPPELMANIDDITFIEATMPHSTHHSQLKDVEEVPMCSEKFRDFITEQNLYKNAKVVVEQIEQCPVISMEQSNVSEKPVKDEMIFTSPQKNMAAFLQSVKMKQPKNKPTKEDVLEKFTCRRNTRTPVVPSSKKKSTVAQKSVKKSPERAPGDKVVEVVSDLETKKRTSSDGLRVKKPTELFYTSVKSSDSSPHYIHESEQSVASEVVLPFSKPSPSEKISEEKKVVDVVKKPPRFVKGKDYIMENILNVTNENDGLKKREHSFTDSHVEKKFKGCDEKSWTQSKKSRPLSNQSAKNYEEEFDKLLKTGNVNKCFNNKLPTTSVLPEQNRTTKILNNVRRDEVSIPRSSMPQLRDSTKYKESSYSQTHRKVPVKQPPMPSHNSKSRNLPFHNSSGNKSNDKWFEKLNGLLGDAPELFIPPSETRKEDTSSKK